jgi:hypothetical protein
MVFLITGLICMSDNVHSQKSLVKLIICLGLIGLFMSPVDQGVNFLMQGLNGYDFDYNNSIDQDGCDENYYIGQGFHLPIDHPVITCAPKNPGLPTAHLSPVTPPPKYTLRE